MSEKKNELFTESFENVFSTFYDQARAAMAGPSGSSNRMGDDILNTASDALKESVQAIVDEFQNTGHTPKTSEEDSKGLVESRNQIHKIQPTPPKDETAPIVEANKQGSSQMLPADVYKPLVKQDIEQAIGKQVVLRTINPSHIIDFEWSLENFSKYVEDMYSSFFSGDGCSKMWQAHIALSTIITSKVELIELFFILNSIFKGKIQAYFNLGIYNSKGHEFGKWKRVVEFTEDCRRHSCFKTVRPPDCESSEEIKLDDDEFIIKGRIGFVGCCVSTHAVDEPKLNIGTDIAKPV